MSWAGFRGDRPATPEAPCSCFWCTAGHPACYSALWVSLLVRRLGLPHWIPGGYWLAWMAVSFPIVYVKTLMEVLPQTSSLLGMALTVLVLAPLSGVSIGGAAVFLDFLLLPALLLYGAGRLTGTLTMDAARLAVRVTRRTLHMSAPLAQRGALAISHTAGGIDLVPPAGALHDSSATEVQPTEEDA